MEGNYYPEVSSHQEGSGKSIVDQKCEDLKGTKAGFKFEKTLACSKCRLEFLESDTTSFKGKVFGIPCGCSKDIPQLASKGRK